MLLSQVYRLLRADFLAHAAVNAAQHVDVELPWPLFHVGMPIASRNRSWRDPDGPGRTDKFTKLAGNTLFPPLLIRLVVPFCSIKNSYSSPSDVFKDLSCALQTAYRCAGSSYSLSITSSDIHRPINSSGFSPFFRVGIGIS